MKKIIDRIQKIMAHIDEGSNEHVVKVAKTKLYRLLNKHKLSRADYEINDDILVSTTYTGKSRSDMIDASLFVGCAHFCGCEYFFNKYSTSFVGKYENIKDTIFLCESLSSQVDAASYKWYNSNRKAKDLKPKHMNDFRRNMVRTIHFRLNEITKGHVKYNGEMGLVVIDDTQQAKDFIRKKINLVDISRTYESDNEIKSEAIKAGKKVKLTTSIDYYNMNKTETLQIV